MRPATVAALSTARQGWSGPLQPGWERTYYTFTDFAGYMEQLTPRFPGTPEEYARIARECFADLATQHVIYAEVSVDGIVHSEDEDDRFWPVMAALEDARRWAEQRFDLQARYIIGLMRTLSLSSACARVRLASNARQRGMGVVAVDLHGDEARAAPDGFAPAFTLAHELGLGVRAHAGEARDGESVRAAIDVLGVRRVGHGVRALEDPALIERLRTEDITLEVCPTSNVRTGIVPSLRAHPIKELDARGVRVTVNSDDPLPFFTSIEREYRILVEDLGFSRSDLGRLTANAARAAFLPLTERTALMERVREAYAHDADPRAGEQE